MSGILAEMAGSRGIIWMMVVISVLGLIFLRYQSDQTGEASRTVPVHKEESAAPDPKVEVPASDPVRPVRSARAALRLEDGPSSGSGNRPGTRLIPRAALKPTDNIVEFTIVDGFAVGYGDIILGRPLESIPQGRGHAELPPLQLWNRPEIPYLIHPDLPKPERVDQALRYLRAHTPVNFVPHRGERDAIVFEPGSEHCMSALGRLGGLQPIRLSAGCGYQEILHEILHALGFVHEQSRGDRDQYVEVLWDRIDPKYHEQFAMVPEALQEPMKGTSFDYRSILLYEPTAFASSGQVSMVPRGDAQILPVQDGLSPTDIQRLNLMFRGYH